MLVNCAQCNKDFDKSPNQIRITKNNFCSRSCAASFNNKGKQRHPPKERICRTCKYDYMFSNSHRSETFCVGCAEEYKNRSLLYKALTIGEYRNKQSVKDKHPSWVHAHVRSFNRSWNKDIIKKGCQKCGYNRHVELAHIKAVATFPDDALLSEVNAPDNILALCPNHHWEFDNGVLSLEEITEPSQEDSHS